jgi:hypothetical protein
MEITWSSFNSKTLMALNTNPEMPAFQSVFPPPEGPIWLTAWQTFCNGAKSILAMTITPPWAGDETAHCRAR